MWWWVIAFFYMMGMIVIHLKLEKIENISFKERLKKTREDKKLLFRYVFVFITSGFVLNHSKHWGLIYLGLTTYLITSDLFEIRK